MSSGAYLVVSGIGGSELMLRWVANQVRAAFQPRFRRYLAARRRYERYLAAQPPVDFMTLTESMQEKARKDPGLVRAAELYEESIALCRAEGAGSNEATVLYQLGMLRQLQGRIDDATTLFEESIRVNAATAGSDPGTTAGCHYHLGTIAFAGGSVDQVRRRFRMSLAMNAALGDRGETVVMERALRVCSREPGGDDAP